MKKRILSLFLAILMVLLAVPTVLFPVAAAAEAEGNTEGKDVVLSKTVFAPDIQDTWLVFDRYDTATMLIGQYVDVTYPDAWQMGYRSASGVFKAYKRLYKTNAEGKMILAADDSYKTQGGGVILSDAPALMFSGTSDPVIRYTAEYTGTAVIRLNELYFYADNAAALEVLYNGEPLIEPFMATKSLYRASASYEKGTAANCGADLGVIAVEVQKGDTIDFVSRAQDSFAVEELASYGLWDFEIEISYLSDKKSSQTEASGNLVTPNDTLPLPLFIWYDSLGNPLEDGDAREAISSVSGSFVNDGDFAFFPELFDWLGKAVEARINPALIGSLIAENDSYADVLAAYKEYLKTFVSATYESAFTASTVVGGKLLPLNRFPLVSDRNLFSVQMNGSQLTALVDYSFAADRLVSEAALSSAIDAFFANAASVTPSGSTAADLSISADALASGMSFSVEGTNPTGNAAVYKNNNLYLAPNGGVSALTYTIPASMDQVIFSLAPTALAFDGEASAFRFAVAVNGKVVWPAAESSADWATASSLAELQDALASLSLTAKGGDEISLCIADTDTPVSVEMSVTADHYRSVCALNIVSDGKTLYSGLHELDSTVTLAELGLPSSFGKNGVFINYAADSVDLPKTLSMSRDYYVADRVLSTYASISINAAFALNLYVQAEDDATAAGVIIDGVKHEGEAQANGTFLVSLPIMPKEMPEKTFSYRAYQTVGNEDMINEEPASLNAFDFLSAYEEGEDASAALLARTVRYYSLAARDYFENERVTLADDVQTALRENDTDILAMVAAYKAGTDYISYPAGTNVNAFTYRIKGASVKLDDRLGFAFRVDRTDGTPFGTPDLTLRVTNEEGELCYTTRVTEPFDEDGKEVLYFVEDLPATLYGTKFSFTLVDGNGVAQSATLTYSAHAYIARTFDTANGDATTFHYLLRGIYALGEASAAYKENHVDFDEDFYFPVGNGGDALAEGSPVLSETAYDPNNATSLSAAQLATTTLSKGGVYRLTEGATLSGSSFNGNGAVLIAPNGLVIDGTNNFKLSNVTIAGSLVIRNSQNVIIENSQILHEGATAVTVEASAESVVLNACRIVGRDAVINAADELTVMNSYLGFERYGVRDTADCGTTVENCRLVGSGVCEAIRSGASEAAFRQNTILLERSSASGIVLAGDGTTENVLVAQNVITGAHESLTVSGMLNTSVVLNSTVMIRASGNKNLYVCDNAVGGKLVLEGNSYLLANGNVYPTDEKDHAAVSLGNANINGDDITDIHARADVGVNEDLLPHVDKDLFTYMDRKDTVKEVNASEESTVYDYITKHAAASPYVVVAPGVYTTTGPVSLNAAHSDTTIYAYGVYVEAVEYTDRNYAEGHIRVKDAESIAFKGLSIGFAQQSNGQVYVLDKQKIELGIWNTYKATVVAGAGFWNEFCNSGSAFMTTTEFGLQRAGTFNDLGEYFVTSVKKNGDGTMTLTLQDKTAYDALVKGDILTCRLGDSATVVSTNSSKDILYEDFTMYGYARAFAFYEYQNMGGVTYNRVLDTQRLGKVIDKETYDRYRALETKHGVDLEISTDTLADGTTVYRGAPAHVASIDGVHNEGSVNGSTVISSIFEGLCDDMSNQKSAHARLSDYIKNDDGTVTLIYKGNITQGSYDWTTPESIYGGYCAPFRAGDRVYIYTADGQLVCDGAAILDGVYYDTIGSTFDDSALKNKGTLGMPIKRYAVTVNAECFNESALDGFDLSDDSYAATEEKVLVDNMSRASYGFHLDNVLVQNGRSGVRAKASSGVVEHCTFRNLAKTVTAMVYEIFWGESGIVRDYTFQNNLIDNTGYAGTYAPSIDAPEDKYRYTPICIIGLGGYELDEEHMLFRNVLIEGNKFVNRYLGYYNAAIFVRAACDLTIKNNDFGSVSGENSTKYCGALYLDRVLNVELSGNTYSSYVQNNALYVQGTNYKNIFGTDVTAS